MPLPTPAQIDAAVPVDGIPSRALVNAVLKEVLAAMSYLPDDGTVPTRSVGNENFSGGRMKTAVGTDPDDCVNLQQLSNAIQGVGTVDPTPDSIVKRSETGTVKAAPATDDDDCMTASQAPGLMTSPHNWDSRIDTAVPGVYLAAAIRPDAGGTEQVFEVATSYYDAHTIVRRDGNNSFLVESTQDDRSVVNNTHMVDYVNSVALNFGHAVPATSSSSGLPYQAAISEDEGLLYICIAPDTWRAIQLTSF